MDDLQVSRTTTVRDAEGREVRVWEEAGWARLQVFVPGLAVQPDGRQLPILTVKAPDVSTASKLAEATLLVAAGRWP